VCVGAYRLRARARNVGKVPVGGRVVVGLLTFEDLDLTLDSPIEGEVHAIIDDGGGPHTWHECRTDNNQSEAVPGGCDIPD
jgi:hypothetical protein